MKNKTPSNPPAQAEASSQPPHPSHPSAQAEASSQSLHPSHPSAQVEASSQPPHPSHPSAQAEGPEKKLGRTLLIERYFNDRSRLGSIDTDKKGRAEVGSTEHGAVLHLEITADQHDVIEAARFKVHGDAVMIATAAFIAEAIEGLSLEDACQWRRDVIKKTLLLPSTKLYCAAIAEDAIQTAIRDYRSHE